jgi:hypothetical protein
MTIAARRLRRTASNRRSLGDPLHAWPTGQIDREVTEPALVVPWIWGQRPSAVSASTNGVAHGSSTM